MFAGNRLLARRKMPIGALCEPRWMCLSLKIASCLRPTRNLLKVIPIGKRSSRSISDRTLNTKEETIHASSYYGRGQGFSVVTSSDLLIGQGHEVIALDNLITGRAENIAHLMGNPKFSFVKYNVL